MTKPNGTFRSFSPDPEQAYVESSQQLKEDDCCGDRKALRSAVQLCLPAAPSDGIDPLTDE